MEKGIRKICMVALVSAILASVSAAIPAIVQAEMQPHAHCVCGNAHMQVGTHTAEDERVWTAISTAEELQAINEAGNYYLTSNIELSTTWSPVNGVAMCLNGYTISATKFNYSVITLNKGVTFTLTDCHTGDEAGKITGSNGTRLNSGYYGGGIYMAEATLNMYGGKIADTNMHSYGASHSLWGGGIYASASTIHMYGGEISGNSAYEGGGVYLSQSASHLYMYGGKIANNSAYYVDWFDEGYHCYGYGGGVAGMDASFTMYGGEIFGNESCYQSAVDCTGVSSTFTMHGGKIYDNPYCEYGWLESVSSSVRANDFVMTGGEISSPDTPGVMTDDAEISGGSIFAHTKYAYYESAALIFSGEAHISGGSFRAECDQVGEKIYGVYASCTGFNEDTSKLYITGKPTFEAASGGVGIYNTVTTVYLKDGAATYTGDGFTLGINNHIINEKVVYDVFDAEEFTGDDITPANPVGYTFQYNAEDHTIRVVANTVTATWYDEDGTQLSGGGYYDTLTFKTEIGELPTPEVPEGKLFCGWRYRYIGTEEYSAQYINLYFKPMNNVEFKAVYATAFEQETDGDTQYFPIYTVYDLLSMRSLILSSFWYSMDCDDIEFRLMNDIDLSSVCGEGIGNWTPINLVDSKAFHFNGNNHTISNLYINDPEMDRASLFGESSWLIENLTVENPFIVGGTAVGAIVGRNEGSIVNCHVIGGSITGEGLVGGIAGENFQSLFFYIGGISDCSNSATVTATNVVKREYYYGNTYLGEYELSGAGGIAGISIYGLGIDGCVNTGTVMGGLAAGGIAGATATTVSNCANEGDVIGVAAVGGVAGATTNVISSSYSTGSVQGDELVGGVLGAPMNEDSRAENSYYLVEETEQDLDNPEQKTQAQFESGEVAYLMSQAEGARWGQDLSASSGPALNSVPVYYDPLTDTYGNTISVHFNMCGFGEQVASITGLSAGDIIVAPVTPTQDRYAFLGWYLDEEYQEECDFSLGVTQPMVLYAKWVQTNLSINGVYYESLNTAFDAAMDGDTIVVEQDYQDYALLNLYGDKSITWNLNGHTVGFDGPFGAIMFNDCSVTIFGENSVVASVLMANNAHLTISGGTYKAVGFLGSTATFNHGTFIGFTEEENQALMAYDDSTIADCAAMFGTNSIMFYYAGSEQGAKDVMHSFLPERRAFDKEVTASDASWIFEEAAPGTYYISTVPANTTVIASYLVSFDALGVTQNPETIIVKHGQTATLPGSVGAAGYMFIGWYVDTACQVPFDEATPITQDITLYAKFSHYEEDKAVLNSAIDDLRNKSNALNSALEDKASTDEVNDKVAELEEAIDTLETSVKEYVDDQDVALKTEIQALIAQAKAEANAAAETALDNAVAQLETSLNDKADKTVVEQNIADLQTAVTNAESLSKAYADEKDVELKTEIQALIAQAKAEANAAAETALDNAVAQLETSLNDKADKTVVEQNIADLQTAVTNAESLSKAYADEKDVALKTEIQALIAQAKAEANAAAETALDNAVAQLEASLNDKADQAVVEQNIADLQTAVVNAERLVKAHAEQQDLVLKAQLESLINAAKADAVAAADDAVDEAVASLQTALSDKADKVYVEEKINELATMLTYAESIAEVKIYADAQDALLKAELLAAIESAKEEMLAMLDGVDKSNNDALLQEIEKLQTEIDQIERANAEQYKTVIIVALGGGLCIGFVAFVFKRKD